MKLSLTVDEFCKAHGISRATFYELIKAGKGPATFKLGRLTRVSLDAERAWRESLEAQRAQEHAQPA